jgi:hypothetical protein
MSMRSVMARVIGPAAVACVVFGCGSDPGDGPGVEPGADAAPTGGEPLAGLVSIAVEPSGASLTIEGETPASAVFSAIGEFEDGRTVDITEHASFSISDGTLGSFSGPVFESGVQRGGVARVTARAGGRQGSTPLTLVLRKRYTDPDSDAPPDPGSIFDGAGDDEAMAPELVYPAPDVLVPPNLDGMEIHLLPAEGSTLFELTFASATTDVVVYTTCVEPVGEGCVYTPAPAVWRWIAQSNRGGRVELSARATDEAGSAVGAS